VLFVFVIIQLTLVPLYERNQQLNESITKQMRLYNKMAENGYRFSTGSTIASSNQTILQSVSRSARSRKVTLSRYEQDNSNLRVWFDNAEFDAAIQLIDDLSRQGIFAAQINIDRQDKSGRANLRATLTR
ncbi:MAG: type II secretion system protein GspM, partial [Porticoccaceae bacterium]